MILKGKLITCKREERDFKTKKGRNIHVDKSLFITLAEVNLSEKNKKKLLDAFAESGEKWTPEWLKNFTGYVNLKTKFELPARDLDGNQFNDVLDMITDTNFPWHKAPVSLSLNIKDGAVYPAAIVFTGEGDSFNPFADFDNDEED